VSVNVTPGRSARTRWDLRPGASKARLLSHPYVGPSFLERLLKKPIVAAFHRGATAQQMREALERPMKGILRTL
jgi:hypothetical protein